MEEHLDKGKGIRRASCQINTWVFTLMVLPHSKVEVGSTATSIDSVLFNGDCQSKDRSMILGGWMASVRSLGNLALTCMVKFVHTLQYG